MQLCSPCFIIKLPATRKLRPLRSATFGSNGDCYFRNFKVSFRLINSGTQREILRKRPKNNNKAWIKDSETILSILGDCWKKFICSSLPARLMEESPASKVHLQPATWLTGKFPSRRMSRHLQLGCGHRAQFRSWGGITGGGEVRKWVWPTGDIHLFSSGWGKFITSNP